MDNRNKRKRLEVNEVVASDQIHATSSRSWQERPEDGGGDGVQQRWQDSELAAVLATRLPASLADGGSVDILSAGTRRWLPMSLLLAPDLTLTAVGRMSNELQINGSLALPFDARAVGKELKIPCEGATPQDRWKRDKDPAVTSALADALFGENITAEELSAVWRRRKGTISLAHVISPFREFVMEKLERWYLSGETRGAIGPGVAWGLYLAWTGQMEMAAPDQSCDFSTPMVRNLLARLRHGTKPTPDGRRLLVDYVLSCLRRKSACSQAVHHLALQTMETSILHQVRVCGTSSALSIAMDAGSSGRRDAGAGHYCNLGEGRTSAI